MFANRFKGGQLKMKINIFLKIIILSIIGILFLQTHLYAINYYDLLCDKLKNVDDNNKMNKMYEYLNSLTPEQQLLLTRQMFDVKTKNNRWLDASPSMGWICINIRKQSRIYN